LTNDGTVYNIANQTTTKVDIVGLPGATKYYTGINDAGQIVGYYYDSNGVRTFVATPQGVGQTPSVTVNNGLAAPIGYAGAKTVALAVGGLASNDNGTLTFTDGTSKVTVMIANGQVVAGANNTTATVDLSSLADDKIINSSLSVSDAAGNMFAANGNAVMLDQDVGEQAALKLNVTNNLIGAAGASAVAFNIAGLDPEDTGKVTFTDSNGNTVPVGVNGAQSSYMANLTSLADGTITSSLAVNTDPAGNSFTPIAGNSVSLDQDLGEQGALKLNVTNSLIGAADASAVAFTIAGLDPEDTGKVTFTDSNGNTVPVGVNGAQSSYTANLTSLADGPITSSLAVNTDPAGNPFTPIAGNSVSLDQDLDEQGALKLTVNGGAPIEEAIANAVPFTAVGFEPDDNGYVSFSDGAHPPVVVKIANGVLASNAVNLSGLNDGTIKATLHLDNDAAGNSFNDVSVNATLDQGGVPWVIVTVNNGSATPIGYAGAKTVALAVVGLASDNNGTLIFSDGGSLVKVPITNGAAPTTVDLSSLADDKTITSSLSVHDAGGQ
jgi:hypothetical protein